MARRTGFLLQRCAQRAEVSLLKQRRQGNHIAAAVKRNPARYLQDDSYSRDRDLLR